MQLNQVTIPCKDYNLSVEFYKTLGMVQIVDSPPRYARFEAPDGSGATLSLHQSDQSPTGDVVIYFDHESAEALDQHVDELKQKGLIFDSDPRDERWQWREARLRDPSGNVVCLMYAGDIRRFPPWRIKEQQVS